MRCAPLIDDFAPAWQFRETRRIGVLAPPDAAWRAIREVTAREIRLFRLLTWVRRLGIPGPASILNAPPDEPIIDVALRTGFMSLGTSPREIVLGTTVVMPRGAARPTSPDEFLALRSPGWAKAAMSFRGVAGRPNAAAIPVSATSTPASPTRMFSAFNSPCAMSAA